MMQVFLNGEIIPYSEAVIPVEDRSFLFADGIYEVIRVYRGVPFALDEHLDRLYASARALDLDTGMERSVFETVIQELLSINQHQEATVYIQISRGTGPRSHDPGEELEPTQVIITRPYEGMDDDERSRGVGAVTVSDNRWGLCYIKTVGLLPNTLAKQKAHRAGAYEAIFVRDGLVTEGSSSNVFIVRDGIIFTHPLANILPGITRKVVLELVDQSDTPLREQAFPVDELYAADEVFLTGTNTEVLPVIEVDGREIGSGTPGPVTRQLSAAFRDRVDQVAAGH